MLNKYIAMSQGQIPVTMKKNKRVQISLTYAEISILLEELPPYLRGCCLRMVLRSYRLYLEAERPKKTHKKAGKKNVQKTPPVVSIDPEILEINRKLKHIKQERRRLIKKIGSLPPDHDLILQTNNLINAKKTRKEEIKKADTKTSTEETLTEDVSTEEYIYVHDQKTKSNGKDGHNSEDTNSSVQTDHAKESRYKDQIKQFEEPAVEEDTEGKRDKTEPEFLIEEDLTKKTLFLEVLVQGLDEMQSKAKNIPVALDILKDTILRLRIVTSGEYNIGASDSFTEVEGWVDLLTDDTNI